MCSFQQANGIKCADAMSRVKNRADKLYAFPQFVENVAKLNEKEYQLLDNHGWYSCDNIEREYHLKGDISPDAKTIIIAAFCGNKMPESGSRKHAHTNKDTEGTPEKAKRGATSAKENVNKLRKKSRIDESDTEGSSDNRNAEVKRNNRQTKRPSIEVEEERRENAKRLKMTVEGSLENNSAKVRREKCQVGVKKSNLPKKVRAKTEEEEEREVMESCERKDTKEDSKKKKTAKINDIKSSKAEKGKSKKKTTTKKMEEEEEEEGQEGGLEEGLEEGEEIRRRHSEKGKNIKKGESNHCKQGNINPDIGGIATSGEGSSTVVTPPKKTMDDSAKAKSKNEVTEAKVKVNHRRFTIQESDGEDSIEEEDHGDEAEIVKKGNGSERNNGEEVKNQSCYNGRRRLFNMSDKSIWKKKAPTSVDASNAARPSVSPLQPENITVSITFLPAANSITHLTQRSHVLIVRNALP